MSMPSSTGNSTKSSQTSVCVILGCLAVGLCFLEEAAAYQATTDFSIAGNPNGTWSYLVSGSLLAVPQANCNSNLGIACWQNGLGPPNFAGILQNTTASPWNPGFLTLNPGAFDVDPENNTNVTIRWTAPSTGSWAYSGFFSGLDTTSNVHTTSVVLNSSTTLWTIPINGFGSGSSFSGTVSLNAGDTLDFVVATGSTYTSLGTGFDATILVDTDGDGIPDVSDNCPFAPNPTQTDSGGINTTVPDGIGDACQCGDVTGDGIVNIGDKTILSKSLAGLPPYFSVGAMPGFDKCDVNGDGVCNVADKTIISRALAALGPGIQQKCTAAVCHSPEMMNGVTCPVLP